MTEFRVAAVSVNQTPLDWDGNEANLRRALAAARASGARLVCFPELCISGYGCEDAFLWPATAEQSWRVLGNLLADTHGLAVSFGIVLPLDGQLYNAAALVVDGELCGLAVKRHLAGEGLHYEPRWFRGWPAGKQSELSYEGRLVPVGDLVFELGGVRIGFEICEDAWVPARPGHELCASAVDVILNPSASHFAFGKHEVRKQLVLSAAEKFGAAYVYANLLGNEAGRAIYDGDAWIACEGVLAVRGRRFSFAPFVVTTARVDVEAERRRRRAPDVPAPTRPLMMRAFDWGPSANATTAEAASFDEASKDEAFGRAVALGLRDYLRKSGSRACVVSLSGGADSAAVAVLVRLMVRLGSSELGYATFLRSLLPAALEDDPLDERALLRRVLLTVYQATENSSEVTRSAAREVAEALGAEHFEWNVQDFVTGYRGRIEEALGRQLTWQQDDLALQNIQARVRAPGVWMLANLRGALLLATSNRSEAAVGYATMDGDTAGGLSPLAGIDKAYLRRWLLHIERHGLGDLPPIPALGAVNRQAPTAELRPLERHQTDESDLMPYEVLDVAERSAVVRRKSPREVLQILVEAFPDYDRATLLGWTVRFFRLFAQSQWKRERFAPSFHVDDANLDPKTWLRFPILSGGFGRELRELEDEERQAIRD